LRIRVARRINEQGLASDPGPGLERLFQHRVAQHHESHCRPHALALFPEQLLPAELPDQGVQFLIGAGHQRASFVEDGEQVAQPAALAVLMRDLRGVQGVDARLGARKRQPAQGVEQVVAVLRPGLHLA